MEQRSDDGMPELIEVDGRPPPAPTPAKEEAGQRALTIFKRSWSMVSDKDVEEEILKGLQCSICFEPWTVGGAHQTTVLKCGHMFGRSCLELCLKQRKFCPMCNAKAAQGHIRPVFATHVLALDAETRDRYSQMCEDEKRRRLEVLQPFMMVLLAKSTQLESTNRLLQVEVRRLRERSEVLYQETVELRRKIASLSVSAPANVPQPPVVQPPLAKQSPAPFPAVNNKQQRPPALPKDVFETKLKVVEQLKIANGRVFAFAGDTLVCPSKAASAAAKWGLWKLSMDDLRQRRFIPTTHDQIIRDVRISSHGGQPIALTGGMDKRLTLTSLDSGAALHSFLLPVPIWSCEWSKSDANLFYAGLSNGSVLAFDMRQLNGPVNVLCPQGGPAIHSLFCHPSADSLVAASSGELRCIQNPANAKTVSRLRFPAAQGLGCSSVSHDVPSDSYLASFRSPDITKHILFRIDQSMTATDQVAWSGLSAAVTLTRTRVFSLPSNDRARPCAVFAATGDEATQSLIVWDSRSVLQQQFLASPHPSPIVDVQFSARGNAAVLGSLSESLLQLYVPDV